MTGAPHGTRQAYERDGCRCAECRSEKAARARARRASLDGGGYCPLCDRHVRLLVAHERRVHPKDAR